MPGVGIDGIAIMPGGAELPLKGRLQGRLCKTETNGIDHLVFIALAPVELNFRNGSLLHVTFFVDQEADQDLGLYIGISCFLGDGGFHDPNYAGGALGIGYHPVGTTRTAHSLELKGIAELGKIDFFQGQYLLLYYFVIRYRYRHLRCGRWRRRTLLGGNLHLLDHDVLIGEYDILECIVGFRDRPKVENAQHQQLHYGNAGHNFVAIA